MKSITFIRTVIFCSILYINVNQECHFAIVIPNCNQQATPIKYSLFQEQKEIVKMISKRDKE